MQSHSLCSVSGSSLLALRVSFDRRNSSRSSSSSYFDRKLFLKSGIGRNELRGVLRICSVGDESLGASFDWGGSNGYVEYTFSSSDGENSDGEVILQPIADVDLPSTKEQLQASNDSLTVSAHRLAMIGKARRRQRIMYGVQNNVGLVLFSTFLLLLVDQFAWKLVRLPLAPFYLMRPFLMSLALVSCVGYVCVPLFRILKLRSVVRKGTLVQHHIKKGTPTMGGLYFILIGLIVAELALKFSSIEVSGAAAATIAFAAIGLLDDFMIINNKNNGWHGWMRLLLEAAIGAWFSYWSYTTSISTPYQMKMVVPLPAPLGLVCLKKSYHVLTSFCFVSMANGIDVIDGLDGLAGGIAALAFIGMSIVVLPICSELSVFGASMAGACIGFLFQNRYKASMYMGNTGALALGGALAAMASCTGMFFPLFISSGLLFLETLSIIIQVVLFKATRFVGRRGYKMSRPMPLHHHLELYGIKEPRIVAAAYVVSCVLTLCAAYVGLTSA